MGNLTFKNKKEIKKFRQFFPKKINVRVGFCEEGGFYAEVVTFPGCITQAETFSELIEMVNDAVATVLEIPRKYLPHMPSYMPPLSLAQRFNVFPSVEIADTSVTFSIP
jgi:predicted RNase H-like HicB family nuclease